MVYAIVASPWGTVAQPFETIYTDVLNGTQTILSGQPSPFLTSAAETVFGIAAQRRDPALSHRRCDVVG